MKEKEKRTSQLLFATSLETPQTRRVHPLLFLFTLLSLASCTVGTQTTSTPPPTSSSFTASDGKQLSLRHWNLRAQPKTVVIALHGIEGAARDFTNLGKILSQKSPKTTLYALNLRGGGYDPSVKDRGDIQSPHLWQRDLLELQSCLKKRHPQSRFIWMGESMGSLIAFHTVSKTNEPPEGLVLVSPVVSLEAIPKWQVASLKTAAFLAPRARVSLESLSGGSFQATTSSDHFQQSETNPYHVETYTLRYLNTLGKLSQSMKTVAGTITLPTLILHGGKDALTPNNQIQDFSDSFLKRPTVLRLEKSHHLIFYDKQKDEALNAILNWIALQRG